MLKTCSKCKKDLPIDRFVLSARYRDGHYPICKDCRRATRLKRLAKEYPCSKCQSAPHSPGHDYCERCLRLSKGRTEIPLIPRRRTDLHLCAKCHERPRLKYHRYCQECKNESVAAWWREQGGSWKRALARNEHDKLLARAAVNRAIRRGKLKRQPCEACGNLKSQAHHYLGYARENWLKVKWLCKPHHDDAERILNSLLTEQPLLL